jgi:hypothetical protein
VKLCPKDADHTKANFNECIRDYLEALAGIPNIGNQLICWLRTAKKPALMPMHEFMRCRVQLLGYLESDYLRRMMDIPTVQEKSEQIYFVQPKVHQNKFTNLNKAVPANPLRMIAFFEQCQETDKVAGILEKITKDKKQPKEKSMAHVPTARSRELSYKQHRGHKYCEYYQSNRRDCNNLDLTIVIKTIDAMIVDDGTTRTQGPTSPTTRRMIASAITSKKRATRPCTMTSPLC